MIDQFLDRMPRKDYNCLNFVQEVWLALYGEDIKAKLDKLVGSVINGRVSVKAVKGFERLIVPKSPCFVVMQRFRMTPHIGIYLNGKVLHLRAYGVEYQHIAVAKAYFHSIKFYR